MKIAILSTFFPLRGGIAQFCAALYREFEKQHQVKAFTFSRQYPNIFFPGQTQYVTEKDTADKIPSIPTLDTINPFTYLTTARKINKFNPDLLITKFWMPFFGPSLGYVSGYLKKRGSVCISILDNIKPHEPKPYDLSVTKYFLKRNNAFVVMSDTVKNDLLSILPDAQYSFIPHPLYEQFPPRINRDEACKSLGLDLDKKYLLFFGFIRDYKGLDILLESLKFIPEDYQLIIAGEMYGDFKKYDDIINELNISQKVKKFVRYIDDNEVPLFFSAADVCVLPYKSATQSGIVGIAYHYDLPVIATDTGSLKEMIEPFGTGMIVDEPKPNLLSSAISDYFMFNLREKFEPNIKKYKDIASWSNFASEILNLYHKIKKK